MKNSHFETDISDAQWEFLEPILPPSKRRGRPRTPLRQVMNAMLYIVKTGCQWRCLPECFPPWKTIHHIFNRWNQLGLMQSIHDRLRAFAREIAGKRSRPTAGSIDSQTVRSAGYSDETGYDAGKKIKGRKRFTLVDTLGLLLAVVVCPADTQERAGGKILLETALPYQTWLKKIWVDGGYSGAEFANAAKAILPRIDIEVASRPEGAKGFEVIPRRWVVERTFGWLMGHRRLVRDYERTTTNAIGWIHMAMIRVMLRRIA